MGNIAKKLPFNAGIKAKEVRLIGESGEQLGIMPLYQALNVAREHNLDLVEVSVTTTPPVCRILDYGKYLYEQTKKEREARRNQRIATLREIQVRPKINDHDLEAKIRTVKKLLNEGDKVKVSVIFRGREITHPEIGWKLLQRILEVLKDVVMVERATVMEGKNMNIILSPPSVKHPKGTKEPAKETKVEVKAVKES